MLNESSHYVPFLNEKDSTSRGVGKRFRALLVPVTIAVSGLVVIAMLCSHMDSGSAPVVQRTFQDKLETPASITEAFEAFMIVHEKKYSSEEEKALRLRNFKNNLDFINQHNSEGRNWKVGINHWADHSVEEWRSKYLGYKKPKGLSESASVGEWLNNVQAEDIPKEVNWVTKGCVNPIKDQKACGSCWAFSAVGALEGQTCVALGGKKVNLSEQQLVDCSDKEGDNGCQGGLMEQAFQYVIDEKGICSEEDYPYKAMNSGKCETTCKRQVEITGFEKIPPNNTTAMAAAVAKTGPISVGVDAGDGGWMLYKSGVYDVKCGHQLDHGVLIAGYGTDKKTGEDYWLIRNSWGTSWGEEGYMRLRKGGKDPFGECAVLKDGSRPTGEKIDT